MWLISFVLSNLNSLNQDLYNQPITKLVDFVTAAFQSNPDINIEVFVHKSEKLQEDDKIGVFHPTTRFIFLFLLQKTSGRYRSVSLIDYSTLHQSMKGCNPIFT